MLEHHRHQSRRPRHLGHYRAAQSPQQARDFRLPAKTQFPSQPRFRPAAHVRLATRPQQRQGKNQEGRKQHRHPSHADVREVDQQHRHARQFGAEAQKDLLELRDDPDHHVRDNTRGHDHHGPQPDARAARVPDHRVTLERLRLPHGTVAQRFGQRARLLGNTNRHQVGRVQQSAVCRQSVRQRYTDADVASHFQKLRTESARM